MTKKAKVLLMAPNIKGMKDGINRLQPGLGVGYLAAVLRQAGHEVLIRDTALEGHENRKELNDKMVLIGESDEAIASYISNTNPDVLGISVLFSNMIDHAHTIARIAKDVNPEIKVVLGGNHISGVVRDCQPYFENFNKGIKPDFLGMQDGKVDFYIRGEAEYPFLELVNSLVNDQDFTSIPGLISIRNSLAYINPLSQCIEDINKLPLPARDLVNMEGYFNIGLFHSAKSRSKRVLNVMTSRGCPGRCSFCTTPFMWGTNVRWRKPRNIYEEIKEGIEKYSIGEVQFEDDVLTLNINNLLELCDLITSLGVPWCMPNGTRVDCGLKGGKQDKLYKRMASAGCYQITFGCESGVQRVLNDIIGKNIKLEQIQCSIESAKKADLLVHTFWIVGFPGETREEMEETIEFAEKVDADSYSIAILSPLHGTPIYHQVTKEGLWWDSEQRGKDTVYTKSLIKVNGFSSPQEFEQWVNEKTIYLNGLLKQKNFERFINHYGDDASYRFMGKQT